MNSLSWLLYLGDVSSSIVNASIGVCVIGTLACLVIPMALDGYDDGPLRKKCLIRVASCIVAALFLAVFVPSKNTVYAIAASEYGEDAPEITKARQALNAWLDKQIGDEKPEADK